MEMPALEPIDTTELDSGVQALSNFIQSYDNFEIAMLNLSSGMTVDLGHGEYDLPSITEDFMETDGGADFLKALAGHALTLAFSKDPDVRRSHIDHIAHSTRLFFEGLLSDRIPA